MKFTILHGENYRVARLLRVLSEGERVASTVSGLQSKYLKASMPRLARSFRHQCLQERFHYGVFSFAERWITPKGTKIQGEAKIFDKFEQELMSAVHNDDIDYSILGLQIILETLGDTFLDTIDHRMDERNMGLEKLRRMIRYQEQTHHDFGERYFETRKAHYQEVGSEKLDYQAEIQLAIIDELIEVISVDLESIGIDSTVYSKQVHGAVRSLKSDLQRPDIEINEIKYTEQSV